MSKEEFKKQVKRYFDSINPKRGESTDGAICRGAICNDCMFNKDLGCELHDFFEIMEEFEKWSKEYPVITNKEKFEQIFGIKVTPADCPPASTGRCGTFISCDAFGDCDKCKKMVERGIRGAESGSQEHGGIKNVQTKSKYYAG